MRRKHVPRVTGKRLLEESHRVVKVLFEIFLVPHSRPLICGDEIHATKGGVNEVFLIWAMLQHLLQVIVCFSWLLLLQVNPHKHSEDLGVVLVLFQALLAILNGSVDVAHREANGREPQGALHVPRSKGQELLVQIRGLLKGS